LVLNGFTLQNSATSVTVDTIFPVSGNITLNGGTIVLDKDFKMFNPLSLVNFGNITGNLHNFEFCSSTTILPANAPKFQDTRLVLHNDLTLSGITTFSGTCSVDGNGYRLTLGNSGLLSVNGQLTLHNVEVDGIGGANVKCANDSSLLILDDAIWTQTGDTSFVMGAFQCRGNVIFRGAHTFAYQTLKTSVINANAALVLDAGFTFSYDPVRLASKTLLSFVDATSELVLNGATLHATTTGLNLTKGSMVVLGDSGLSSEIKTIGATKIDNGITFGDGVSASSDFGCDITSGSQLLFSNGSLNYKNLLSTSWLMENALSALHMGTATTLRIYNTLNLGLGVALCEDNVTIARVTSAYVLGNVSAINNLFFQQI
ncbi:MAG: hypothetical protein P4L31_02540, partial [Candidatus Babeliales bacterium]|nr:hypothetical protein [Candidatus Babeliales bacterium]